MRSDTVTACWVHGSEVAYSWHDSLMRLIMSDVGGSSRLLRGGYIGIRYGTGGIADARNKAVAQFLEGDSEWLWWVDTDMGFAVDIIDRLVESADPVSRPVMGGLCFANREERLDGMGGFVTLPMPTVYRWFQSETDTDVAGFVPWVEYPRNEVVQVAGTGSACILVHRSVFEKIAEVEGENWYTPQYVPSMRQVISEDLSFCLRLSAHEIPLHIDTAAKTTHLKPVWVSEATFDTYRLAAGVDVPASVPPAPVASARPMNRAERRRKTKT